MRNILHKLKPQKPLSLQQPIRALKEKIMTVNQHYTLEQLKQGLFIKEIKKSKNKSIYYISGSGCDVFLNELTFIKLCGLKMLKGDNNPANINQHWILSPKGESYIESHPYGA